MKPVYSMLSAGKSEGVYQLQYQFGKETLLYYQPKCFDDLATCLSINKPGILSESNKMSDPQSFLMLEEVDCCIKII